MKQILGAALAAALLACGGSDHHGLAPPVPNGPGSLVTVNSSVALAATGSMAILKQAMCSNQATTYGSATLVVHLSDAPALCAMVQKNDAQANMGVVSIAVARIRLGQSVDIPSGSYPVTLDPPAVQDAAGNWTWALAVLERLDSACFASAIEATGGTVNIASIANGTVTGTADLVFSDGGTVTGASFAAPICDVAEDICGDTPKPDGACLP
jgi:hypothetical protein